MNFLYDPALVLYLRLYELDGGSFMSRDKYGHLCVNTGALWTPEGRKLNGTTDYINCTNNAVLNLTSAWTLFSRAKPSTVTAEGDLIARRDGTGAPLSCYTLEVGDPDGGFTVAWYNGGWRTCASVANLFIVNSEHDFGATWDGTYIRLYLDGVLIKTSADLSATPPVSAPAEPTAIGCRGVSGTKAAFFIGIIRDAGILSRAYTPIEMSHLTAR